MQGRFTMTFETHAVQFGNDTNDTSRGAPLLIAVLKLTLTCFNQVFCC